MKYVILVGDGMADYPINELGDRTPLEAARTPNMDYIAKYGRLGRVKTIPEKMSPASDVANLSILGYDPQKFYTGRGPLEAANLGIELEDDDVAFRCNLVTVSGDRLIDYSAGHISSKEAGILIKFIDQNLGTNRIKFYSGISYRHLMLVKRGAEEHLEGLKCRPPHDITGQGILKNLPKGEGAEIIVKLIEDSRRILERHEINLVRIDLKENPANMIWLWGQGKKPCLPKFLEKYGLEGSVISAVDLLKGLGKILGLEVMNIPGATGYYDTNYEGKAKAALRSLEEKDFVFVHVEAPDEAGHSGNYREKIEAIENFDLKVVGTVLDGLQRFGDYRVMVVSDHLTPIARRTHTPEPTPFAWAAKNEIDKNDGGAGFSEVSAEKSRVRYEKGHELMDAFVSI